MAISLVRIVRGTLAASLVGVLTLGMGGVSTVPASADGPPVTLALTAVDPASWAPISEVESGKDYSYTASVGCPDPNGCGPATLVISFPDQVEFIAGGFNAPPGATSDFAPASSEPNAPGGTLTIDWDPLSGTAVVSLPVRVSPMVETTNNGLPQVATSTLTAGSGTPIDSSAAVTLRAFERPGLSAAPATWADPALEDGSQLQSSTTLTGTAAANGPSSLTFRVPGSESIPSATLPVSEAFDLDRLTLSRNDDGARVTFTLADGTTDERAIPAGSTEVVAPATAVGYEVTISGLPSLAAADDAARTASVTADYTLRDTRRSGGRIIDPSLNAREVRATGVITNTVSDTAPGQPTSASESVRATIQVQAVLPAIDHSIEWVTASGDSTSVYESGEASTLSVMAWNSGASVLRDLTIKLPHLNAKYFEYQRLSNVPEVKFPLGATTATIHYSYKSPLSPGTPHAFTAGEPVPGPDADGDDHALEQITGVTVVFAGVDGQAIDGECDGADLCAAQLTLSSVLRDTQLTSGAAISPPVSNPGSTPVGIIGEASATGARGSIIKQATTQATIDIVKPQFNVTLSKRFGDGTDKAVYPLTGVAKAGDHYDPSLPETAEQPFEDHDLRFVAATKTSEGATERQGASTLTIVDPQVPPTVPSLGSNPFDAVKFTALATAGAECTAPNGDVIGSETTQQAWILDSLTEPTTLTKVAFDSSVSLELIVGLEISITPTDASGRFPVDVTCASAPGTTVKFRHARVSDGTIISPGKLAQEATPGLFNLVNTAELVTGTNTATAIGGDSLYLVDLLRGSVYKHYAKDSKGYGVQGEESPTSFLLSGVPATKDSIATRVSDGLMPGGSMATGQSFDVFKFTGVRDARVGPDQAMTITFVDKTGAPIGPTGLVQASTELKDRDLTPEEIEDSQSAGYLEFQKVGREIAWEGAWEARENEKVASVRFEVARADGETALQRFGAFSLTLDATLRSALLSDPSTEITGLPSGKPYSNAASIRSLEGPSPGTWGNPVSSSLRYRVFAATDLYAHADATWTDANTSSDRYMVAKFQTPSKILLSAENRTAVGVSGEPTEPDPWDQWSLTGSIGVGVERLSVGVSGDPAAGRNPFAITDFAGITEMTWPVRTDALDDEPNALRRVAGAITYSFAAGSSLVVDAPVGAAVGTLNPPKDRWADVVGVSVTWAETGKFVGVTRPAAANQGRLAFTTKLRDVVRDDYSYKFVEGGPQSLAPGESIDGALQDVPQVVDQFATLDADYRGVLSDVDDVVGSQESGRIMLDVARRGVSVGAEVQGGALYRDIGTRPQQGPTTWTLSNTNSGNIPMSGLWLATDKALLDRANWPQTTPEDYELPPGSALDAFDISDARLSFPVGAATATVWTMDADGVWSDAMVVTSSNVSITLPTSGPGPKAWGDVAGVRVQFDADEASHERIAKRATGSLALTTKLRETLRSDPSEIAPSTVAPPGATPADSDRWRVEMTAAGTAHVGKPGTELTPYSDRSAVRTVLTGTPQPYTGKFTGAYDPAKPLPQTSTVGNPGSWTNFFVVLRNSPNATSNLYGLSGVDTVPEGLRYSAVNEFSEWKVVSAPTRLSEPDFTITPSETTTTMRWDWEEDDYLKPGEYIVLHVPLQMTDGLTAGSTVTNLARIVGSGIEGVQIASVCASETGPATPCTAQAYVTSMRSDSVRAESYLDASVGGSATQTGEACDATTLADWADGTWVRNPCVTETTAGGSLKHRLKLINSGNISLAELRFTDELPKRGDAGTVLDAARGSEWTPSLVPGSVRLLVDDEATALGARGDGALRAGFRYSATAKPCSLSPDAFSSPDTLACTSSGAAWSGQATADTQAFGADVVFEPTSKLAGGDFVIVEFAMTVPSTNTTPEIAWNTAAVTGRTSASNNWMPASESPRSGARTQDTTMSVVLGLEDAPVTSWHRDAEAFGLTLSCLPPGASEPTLRDVVFDESVAGPYPKELTISGLPRGGSCEIVDESYDPSSVTADGQYGAVSDGATGYSFATDPAKPLVLEGDGTKNVLSVTNTFVESTVEVGVEVEGSASGMIPADAEFTVDLSCSFAGIERGFGPFKIRAGEPETVTGLPVGAVCTSTETDHRGAGSVTATVDSTPASLDEQRSLTLEPLAPGAHDVTFVNTFEAGGTLSVLKRVELPRAGLAVGDVAFSVSCELGGYPIDIGDRAELRHTFAPGETEAMLPVTGIPAGAECTVSETVTGGADVPAPDRMVTVLPEDEVIVEMLNVFEPAALELTKTLAGPGAQEVGIPNTFDLRATCSRELTIGGGLVTVTDFDWLSAVVPNEPLRIGELPAGSSCAVTEPDLRGAESVELVSLTPDAPDENPSADALLVTLVGPDTDGDAVATRVQVTNRFAAAAAGLGSTGGAGWLFAGGIGVLLLGLGAVALTRRRGAVAE